MLRTLLAASIALGTAVSTHAFSLLGPFETWQTADLYYNPPDSIYGVDIGAPQNLGEEYRWNVPTIYYGFDYTFLDYYGQKGVEAVESAIATFNELPAFSEMSADLREYPNSTQRLNYRASALGLVDLKSLAMSFILEELGVAHSERFVWTLRARELLPGAACPVYEHRVVKRSFDPETWFPTSYVNDVLYTYLVLVTCTPDQSHALEYPVDPTAISHTSISANVFGYHVGGFFTGLTRDDVGALRYLYRANNFNTEDLPPGSVVGLAGGLGGGVVTGGSGEDAWVPISSPTTNAPVVGDPTTGTAPTIALRPGVEKLRFVRVNYDSTLSANFDVFTNVYSSGMVTNGRLVAQTVRRPVVAPDLVFSAADLLDNIISRTPPDWVQSPVANGGQDLNGPGVIPPGNAIVFNKFGPAFASIYPLLGEDSAIAFVNYGSFDGSTNAPVVYPSHLSIQELERQVLGR